MFNALKNQFHSQLYRILPGQCVLCGFTSHRALDLCETCQQSLQHNHLCCDKCALPLQYPSLCGACIAKPPPFNHALAPWLYTPPVSDFAKAFKNAGNLNLANLLLTGLIETIEQQANLPDALVPIPLFWRKRFMRGFNQAHWLGKQISQYFDIPLLSKTLYKNRATPPQRTLNRKQRQQNLRGSFDVHKPLNGQHIALIDDVMTTGSTAEEAAKTLLKAGASKVDVWCLARTPLEN